MRRLTGPGVEVESLRNSRALEQVAQCMNFKLALASALALALLGCSTESKQDYSQAGQSLKNAAQETGSAIKKDAEVATEAAKNAATAAKNTAKRANDGKR